MTREILLRIALPDELPRCTVEQSRRVVEAFDDLCLGGERIDEIEQLSFKLFQELLQYLVCLGVNIETANKKYLEVSNDAAGEDYSRTASWFCRP